MHIGMHTLNYLSLEPSLKQCSDRGLLYKLSFRTLIVEFECFQMLTSLYPVVHHLVIWILVSYPRL